MNKKKTIIQSCYFKRSNQAVTKQLEKKHLVRIPISHKIPNNNEKWKKWKKWIQFMIQEKFKIINFDSNII